MNVVQLFRASVLRDPSHACLMYKADGAYQTLTYEQVWHRIVRVASSLRDLGVREGDKVAIMAETSPAWTICDFAILALGAVVVPIYPSLPAHEAVYMMNNAEAKYFITDSPTSMSALRGVWPEAIRAVILLEESPVRCDKPVYAFRDFFQDEDETPLDPSLTDTLIPSNALATIVHTSGTSGRPKGVMLSHQNLTANIEACLSMMSVEKDDITLSYLPLSHIFERTVGHFCVFAAGGTIAYAEGLDKIQQNLLEVRPTVLITVPRLLEKVYTGIHQKLDAAPRAVRTFVNNSMKKPNPLNRRIVDKLVYAKLRSGFGGRLRIVISGGSGLAERIAKFFREAGIPVCEGYGMTESAPVISFNPVEDIRPGTVGKPIPNVQVKLADDGEVLVKGPNVMMGYYGDPLATSEAIDEDGWLHTGDISVIEDGYVRVVERKKHLLVLATGKNVAPYPIENAITVSPYIADAVLVGDDRKYVGSLIVPDFAALSDLARTHNLDESDFELWNNHPAIRRLLQEEIRKAVEPFAEFERPKRAILLSAPFTLGSGEITPTLKVKAKVVLQRYARDIEAMYEGTRYLDIYGSVEHGIVPGSPLTPMETNEPMTGGSSLAASSEAATPEAKVRRRRTRRWVAAGLVAVLIGLSVGLAKAGIQLPKNLNLLSTIKHVHKNNDQINGENTKIVQGMQNVSQLSGLTPAMASQLQSLSTGLNDQNDRLSSLTRLSVQEIGLSKQFGAVASALNGDLGNVASSTQQQSNAVQTMSKTAADIERLATQLEQTNQTMAKKLNQATASTKQISTEVP
ncbi:AMP-dependent synthetase/ligase [Alicyclobacillus dauci]|uniref:AMP-binding protein n=1 Tax=Alicyclobacillus dauci TaxID=1475485 RepID=A0ABY6Z1A8_9BACL|nr:AMP-binding protein [Alicyclobacillus dauci]WAH36141.1 AMP-binding protein [Alicyclobacillus dauci]